jgi:hypothetical protein
MSDVKWFSGGGERSDQAISIITSLLQEIKDDTKCRPLQEVLIAYRNELQEKNSAVPFILSRMSIKLSQVISKNGILLSKEQSDMLKKLNILSNIRYGY